jgi:hypothetical protein
MPWSRTLLVRTVHARRAEASSLTPRESPIPAGIAGASPRDSIAKAMCFSLSFTKALAYTSSDAIVPCECDHLDVIHKLQRWRTGLRERLGRIFLDYQRRATSYTLSRKKEISVGSSRYGR